MLDSICFLQYALIIDHMKLFFHLMLNDNIWKGQVPVVSHLMAQANSHGS